ncbi:ribonuclease E/G [Kytococcus sedentarius]|uniref:ribonuclease E/G n=1 Tax=Kytococcus sedentarius TaxID=1276 RepID=UPI0019525D00|nr:ribonuclease E/G [Kytococcus sedentarius]QRO88177.1 Rne/Rng family ribonuclease [Kytococcus sedentarius]
MDADQTQQPGSFALLFQAPDPEAMRATRQRGSEQEVDDEQERPARRSRGDAQAAGRPEGRRQQGRGNAGRGRSGADQDAAVEQDRDDSDAERDSGDSDESTGGRQRPQRRSRTRGERGSSRGQRGDEGRDGGGDDPTGSGRGGSARGEDSGRDDRDDQDQQDDRGPQGGHDDDDSEESGGRRSRRRRGGRGRGQSDEGAEGGQGRGGRRSERSQDDDEAQDGSGDESGDSGDSGDDDSEQGRGSRRARKRSRGGRNRSRGQSGRSEDQGGGSEAADEVTGVQGSTRLAAKKQRRREGREAGRRRTVLTEAEFLARRESVHRTMVVRESAEYTQVGVLEDDVLVEHYIDRQQQTTMVGNVYLGRVQNVLPSMEAAFVDIGKGRNGVLYAGEVNWDAAGLPKGEQKRIESALQPGQPVLVQVTKDPIGHKGARLTGQISLPGRYLVYVPGNTTTGISRKLPDTERARLKKILKDVVPADAGVIVRTAAEGAAEAELRADVERLTTQWERIAAAQAKGSAPTLVHGEPDLTVRVIRDVFNEDFTKLVVSGPTAWESVTSYIDAVAPDLTPKLERWEGEQDVFEHHRIEEQIAKAMDRKVWLPSGGSLIFDRTEAMTVVDVNTGKFVGSGGNLEETVTKNNIEAAEEIVRQLRLRDIGGIIVVDFIDMVLESNRDLVVRRLVECLARDRTKHQVAEVTSLGLVQMTRKRVGSGLVEVYGETCEHCDGHGLVVQDAPVAVRGGGSGGGRRSGRQPGKEGHQQGEAQAAPRSSGPSVAQIARAVHAAALKGDEEGLPEEQAAGGTDESAPQAPAAAVEGATDDAAEGAAEQAPREQTRAEQPATAPKAAAETASPAQATSGDAPAVTGRIGRRSAAPVESAPQVGDEESSSYVGAPVADAPGPAPAPARRSSRRRAASTGAAAPSVTVAPQPAPTTSVAGGAGVSEKSTITRRTPRRRVVAPQGDGASPA